VFTDFGGLSRRQNFDCKHIPRLTKRHPTLTHPLSQTHSFALTGACASFSPSRREKGEATPKCSSNSYSSKFASRAEAA
jgi:hypothetical protein